MSQRVDRTRAKPELSPEAKEFCRKSLAQMPALDVDNLESARKIEDEEEKTSPGNKLANGSPRPLLFDKDRVDLQSPMATLCFDKDGNVVVNTDYKTVQKKIKSLRIKNKNNGKPPLPT